MFEGLTRFAHSRLKARAQRRTEFMLDQLPASVQKDIGWRWSPTLPHGSPKKLIGLDIS